MLDTTTRRRIDSARDTLVGIVPDPKGQVEQITIALIYKFMEDMDNQAEELGGHRKFFTGDFAKYSWSKLLRSGMGGHDMLNLYAEGIVRMPENPGIPLLFRNIFKNAYLTYRNPETLKMFLKIIDEFNYDHSEKLGDAFEYLLSCLSSQGDAGQFRTPRHIIDFIVEIVNPKKNETILDPACGTAGFLISAYKHILKENRESKLTPEEQKKLIGNFTGYDISHDMVRLSLVNMYLHGFTNPRIEEYDTLSDQAKWNERFDVILANPPFMSPKGGIVPHNRFSIQSKRSEVLFVDYMAEHLNPTGRAGIIVPEGIIFQSQNAYKQLRKMLVDEYLVAVVSLPAGIFQPYSGVKTSILFLDKALAKRKDSIAFFKVENDGYGLGAQRREIEKNDLPAAAAFLKDWFVTTVIPAQAGIQSSSTSSIPNALIVEKAKIVANGDNNLSGERYREAIAQHTAFPFVRLEAIAEIAAGNSAPQGEEYFKDGQFPFVRTSDVGAVHLSECLLGTADKLNQTAVNEFRLRLFPAGTILFPKSGASTFLNHRVLMGESAYVSSHLACIICVESNAVPRYVYRMLCQIDARSITPDQAYPSLRLSEIGCILIPLPPLSVQQEIVAEIESYQRVIDGARAVLDNYKPHIRVEPDWEMVKLGEIAKNFDSRRIPITKSDRKEGLYPYYGASGIVDYVDEYIFDEDILLISEDGANLLARSTPIAFSVSGKCWVNNHAHVLKFENSATQKLVEIYLNSISIEEFVTGAAQPKMNQQAMNGILIPLPPLATQQAIVAEIEAEQALVAASRELMERMEKKIKAVIARVWGE